MRTAVNMKNLFKALFMISILSLLTACVSDDSYVQKVLPEVDEEEVSLYYYSPPSCNYHVVGYIELNGTYLSKSRVFEQLISEAAEMGADGVVVDYLDKSDLMGQYVGLGKAIQCLD